MWLISYSHSLYSSFHSWKPCQRPSYTTESLVQYISWADGRVDSLGPNARSLGTNSPSCFSSPSAPLLSTPAHCLFLWGRHPAYLCISWLLICLDPARKSAKRAGGHWLKSRWSSCSVLETRAGRAESVDVVQGSNPEHWSGGVAWAAVPGDTGTPHKPAQFTPHFLFLLKWWK